MLHADQHFTWYKLNKKLNKQGDNIQPWCTPFPIWNPSVATCPVLTVVSWPAHRFLRRQVGGLLSPSLSEFSTVCCDPHSQRLWMINKAEVDVFLELPCFFDNLVDVGNLISGSSAFSKSSMNIWKFTDHVLLKPGLENFEHYFTSMWNECSCVVVWTFFVIVFLWDWNENLLFFFQSVATAKFSKFAGILSVTLSQHHLLGFEIAQLEFYHIH